MSNLFCFNEIEDPAIAGKKVLKEMASSDFLNRQQKQNTSDPDKSTSRLSHTNGEPSPLGGCTVLVPDEKLNCF